MLVVLINPTVKILPEITLPVTFNELITLPLKLRFAVNILPFIVAPAALTIPGVKTFNPVTLPDTFKFGDTLPVITMFSICKLVPDKSPSAVILPCDNILFPVMPLSLTIDPVVLIILLENKLIPVISPVALILLAVILPVNVGK